MQSADVRMMQRRHRARLTFKPLIERSLRNLDRNNAVQPRIPSLIDRTHPALANEREDFAGTELFSGGSGHVV